MTTSGKSALELVRAACAEARQHLAGDQALGLERADTILARLIAEEYGLATLRAQFAPRFQPLSAAPQGNAFQDMIASIQQRIADAAADPSALDSRYLHEAVAADRDYWKAWNAVVQSSIKTSPITAPDTSANEGFDTTALTAFLRREFAGEDTLEVVSATVASRGFSKKTMLVELRGTRALPAEVVLRIDQPFNYLGTTVCDEYPALRHIFGHGVCVPEPLALEATGSVLGLPFIVFRKVPGAPIGNNFISPPRNAAQIAELAGHLAKLHAALWKGVQPSRGGENVMQNLDLEIEKYYRDWRECGAVCPIIEAAFHWVKLNRALGDGPAALVHNDFNYNNILFHDGRVSAIVDWEFVYIGTPAADLSYFHYSAENVDSFENFLRAYAAAGGTVPDRRTLDFYILWGALRLAVMNFQVDQSFRAGRFSDIRFGIAGTLFIATSQERVSSKLVELLQAP